MDPISLAEPIEHTSVFEEWNTGIHHTIGGKPSYSAYLCKCPPQYLLEGLATAKEQDMAYFNLEGKAVYVVADTRPQEYDPTYITNDVRKSFIKTQLKHIRMHLGDFREVDNPNEADKIIMITGLINKELAIKSIAEDEFISSNRGLIDEGIAKGNLIFVKLSV